VSEELRFDGRVAVVTGAGRGIGASHARALAGRGARVVVNDIGAETDGLGTDATPAEEVAAGIVAAGGQAVASTDSVATPEGADAIVATALDHFGRIDVVVNNAGIITLRPLLETDTQNVVDHLAVHLVGAFNVTRAAWPHMREAGYGRVVMTASSAIFGIAIHIGYAAAKAGTIGLVKSLALVDPDLDITVNAIVPLARTRMASVPLPAGSALAAASSSGESPPMDAELVSSAVLYLTHESCSLNGEVIGAGAGTVDRVFFAATAGYFNPTLTPEDVAENLALIVDESSYRVPGDNLEHVDHLLRRSGGLDHPVDDA
jgi:NAD(P)-dependent dehydrogenase (short-subunit alcohol dehydrogenase family)